MPRGPSLCASPRYWNIKEIYFLGILYCSTLWGTLKMSVNRSARCSMGNGLTSLLLPNMGFTNDFSRMWARMKYSAIFHQIAHLNKEFGRRRGISLLWGWWWPGSGRWAPREKPRFRLSRRRLSKKGGNIFSTIPYQSGMLLQVKQSQESLAVFQKFVSGSIITWQESSGSRKKFSHLGVPGFHLLLCTYRGNEEKSRSPFSPFAL